MKQPTEKKEDENIILTGKISTIPGQHLVSPQAEYPVIDYFESDDRGEMVIYSKESLPRQKKLKIKGTIFKVQGTSKKPGSNKVYSENSMRVDSWMEVK